MTISCPTDDELREFNDGRISDKKVVDQISDHLGTCDRCIETLEQMEPDALAKGLHESLVGVVADEPTRHDESDESSGMYQNLLSNAVPSGSTWQKGKPRPFGEQQYRILAYIGEGSFGRVFLGLNESDELCAVKITDPRKLVAKSHQKQFLQDCELAQTIHHPNVLPLIDYGLWDEQRGFYAMHYVEAPTLTEVARKAKSISGTEAQRILDQVAEALKAAHEKGVIHRHLHPDNILLENWESEDETVVHVLDFGFIYDSRYQFGLLEPKTETTLFDSPECVNNNVDFIDPRADVFSLGKTLKLLMRIAPPQDEFNKQSLADIVQQATSTRRRGRFRSIEDFQTAANSFPLG